VDAAVGDGLGATDGMVWGVMSEAGWTALLKIQTSADTLTETGRLQVLKERFTCVPLAEIVGVGILEYLHGSPPEQEADGFLKNAFISVNLLSMSNVMVCIGLVFAQSPQCLLQFQSGVVTELETLFKHSTPA